MLRFNVLLLALWLSEANRHLPLKSSFHISFILETISTYWFLWPATTLCCEWLECHFGPWGNSFSYFFSEVFFKVFTFKPPCRTLAMYNMEVTYALSGERACVFDPVLSLLLGANIFSSTKPLEYFLCMPAYFAFSFISHRFVFNILKSTLQSSLLWTMKLISNFNIIIKRSVLSMATKLAS